MNRESMEHIDACLDGTLSPEDFKSLQDELRTDPAALAHWCHQAEMHGRLEWELGAAATAFVVPPPRRQPFRLAAAAAALVMLGIGVGMLIRPASAPKQDGIAATPPLPVRGPLVARLTSADGARWAGLAPVAGEWIPCGMLDLTAGRALISFDCGATVQITGPVRLHLTSPTRTLLESGEAFVNITDHAYGFVFETPTVQISRRKSSFHAVVDSQGHTDLGIIEGQVQVSGKLGDLESMTLGENHNVRIDPSGNVEPAVVSDHVWAPQRMRESADLLPEWYLHWGFDGTDDAVGSFEETGVHPILGSPFGAQAHYPHPDAAASIVPGRFGNSVRLNGQLAFLATEFRGISGNAPRSIAFWVKIDPNTPDTLAYAMLSWGALAPEGGGKWQLCWNTGGDNSGTLGAIRTEVDGGFLVGSTDLRTGDWHHVVSVFTGGDRADAASIRHYVDGRLESTTAVVPHTVSTRTSGSTAFPLTIGRRINKDSFFRGFRGDFDEVYLFPCALTPEQINRLYHDNLAPSVQR